MAQHLPPGALEPLTRVVVRAAFEVHRRLGPGLPQRAYVDAFSQELLFRRTHHQRRVPVPVFYRGVRLSDVQELDLCVGGKIAVDVRVGEAILPAHRLALRARLRMTGLDAGLIVNFHAARLRDGLVLIRRANGEGLVVPLSRGDGPPPLPATQGEAVLRRRRSA